MRSSRSGTATSASRPRHPPARSSPISSPAGGRSWTSRSSRPNVSIDAAPSRRMDAALSPPKPDAALRARIDDIYRTESRRVFATLVRLLGGFDVAEEALHDAFRAALEQWPREGMPANPRAWLVSTGRFKAIDAIRRQARFEAPDEED